MSATIDLGVVNAGHHRPERAPHSRVYVRPKQRRAIGVTVVAVLLGTVLPAGSPPEPPPMALLATVAAGDAAVLDDTTLYVYRHHGEPALVAYRLSDGTRKWESAGAASAAPAAPPSWVQVSNGVPLATTLDVKPIDGRYHETIAAYEPDTGEQRWTRTGWLSAAGTGVVVLMQPPPGQDPADGRPTTMPVAVNLVTGEEVWTGPPAQQWAFDLRHVGSGHLVGLDQDSVMTSYHADTGVLATTVIGSHTDPYDTTLYLIGDLVVLHSMAAAELLTYDLKTLAPRWTATLPAGSWPVAECGQVLCGYAAGGLFALDLATGELTESTDLDARPGQPDQFWPPGLGPQWPSHLLTDGWLLDAATGQRLLPLQEWEHLPAGTVRSTSRVPVLSWPEWFGVDTPHTWFGRLRTDPTRVEVIGRADGRLDNCAATATHLVCRDLDDLHIWRLS